MPLSEKLATTFLTEAVGQFWGVIRPKSVALRQPSEQLLLVILLYFNTLFLPIFLINAKKYVILYELVLYIEFMLPLIFIYLYGCTIIYSLVDIYRSVRKQNGMTNIFRFGFLLFVTLLSVSFRGPTVQNIDHAENFFIEMVYGEQLAKDFHKEGATQEILWTWSCLGAWRCYYVFSADDIAKITHDGGPLFDELQLDVNAIVSTARLSPNHYSIIVQQGSVGMGG